MPLLATLGAAGARAQDLIGKKKSILVGIIHGSILNLALRPVSGNP